jgi:hypothetical protein
MLEISFKSWSFRVFELFFLIKNHRTTSLVTPPPQKPGADAAWYTRDTVACYGATADGRADSLLGEGQALKGKKRPKYWR